MSTDGALLATITHLSQALDDVDLVGALDVFSTAARTAVSSYLGCLVRSIDNDPTIEFTYGPRLDPNPGAPIPAGATLLLMASGSDPSRSPVQMVLYASNPGAFVDLAADLAVITGLDADHFVLDQHINGALTIADTAPATAVSTVNQATGVLIASGLTPTEATDVLDWGPQSSAAHRLAAASRILTALPQPVHGSDPASALSTD